jgi:hypothetical protein
MGRREPWQWLGNGFAVEPRYLDGLIEGIEGDGLTVGGYCRPWPS